VERTTLSEGVLSSSKKKGNDSGKREEEGLFLTYT